MGRQQLFRQQFATFRERRKWVALSFLVLFMLHNGANGWSTRPRQPSTNFHPSVLLFSSTQSTLSLSSSSSSVDDENNSSSHRRRRHSKGSFSKNGSIKAMFQEAKNLERQGLWNEASALYSRILEKEPKDAHSHLALARLEARREQKGHPSSKLDPNDEDFVQTTAQLMFANGTIHCPKSVHLWQAWAVYEESRGHSERARELFEEALALEPQNPYVCHAFGLYYKKLGEITRAMALFSSALVTNSTAALVCSLGELLISQGKLDETRELYAHHLEKLTKEKDRIEVYLASAWLEERYFQDLERAKTLLNIALELNPGSSLANVALARFEGRNYQRNPDGSRSHNATAQRLADACKQIERQSQLPSDPSDGRVFNALAQIEVKAKRFRNAREVLKRGMQMYPLDHALFQAAGKVEERVGNYSAARRLYGESLRLEPSAPTLVAYAMLEFRHPESGTVDFARVRGLFEEALLLDPRHGPAYNAYGNVEYQMGNIDEARAVFERGVRADCSDVGSLYHGYGKLELSLGNVDDARSILETGLTQVRAKDVGSDSTHRERAKFLSHTLGMLELNSNRPVIALDIFKDGIQRCGNSSRLLLGAALSEMRLGKDDAARALFERSVVSDKKHAQAWQAWGVMETKAGNFKTASTLFQCGIRNAPSHGALWHGYASLELKKGNIHNARVLYAAGLQKAPNHVPLYQGWALLELREGNHQDARKLIAEALTRNKKNGSGWLIAAQIEEEAGNGGLVSLILRRGIECAPNDPELYRRLGEYLVQKGHYNDAREVFEQGMDFNPLHAPLYHSLAELEARVCNVEGLSKLNQRAASLFNGNVLDPPKMSTHAFATKIRAKRSGSLPKGIAALADKIVDSEDDGFLLQVESLDKIDPSSALESLTATFLEDEFVGGLMSIGDYKKVEDGKEDKS